MSLAPTIEPAALICPRRFGAALSAARMETQVELFEFAGGDSRSMALLGAAERGVLPLTPGRVEDLAMRYRLVGRRLAGASMRLVVDRHVGRRPGPIEDARSGRGRDSWSGVELTILRYLALRTLLGRPVTSPLDNLAGGLGVERADIAHFVERFRTRERARVERMADALLDAQVVPAAGILVGTTAQGSLVVAHRPSGLGGVGSRPSLPTGVGPLRFYLDRSTPGWERLQPVQPATANRSTTNTNVSFGPMGPFPLSP